MPRITPKSSNYPREPNAVYSGKLGTIKATNYRIEITHGARLLYQKTYRASMKTRDIDRQEVDRLLKKDIIEQSHAKRASPVVLIPKSDGLVRFFLGYRPMNTLNVARLFPHPQNGRLYCFLLRRWVFHHNGLQHRVPESTHRLRQKIHNEVLLPLGATPFSEYVFWTAERTGNAPKGGRHNTINVKISVSPRLLG